MKSINLGNSGLKASAVALGCMRIAELDTSELEQLIDASLEAGIDFFDHADIYGGGRCEERFGEYLHTHPDVRDRILIQSKCGIRPASSTSRCRTSCIRWIRALPGFRPTISMCCCSTARIH